MGAADGHQGSHSPRSWTASFASTSIFKSTSAARGYAWEPIPEAPTGRALGQVACWHVVGPGLKPHLSPEPHTHSPP